MKTKLKDASFEKSALFMLILSVTASAFNYLFQIISGRLLSAADYGVLNSAFSASNIITVMGVALGLSVAKNISENESNAGGKINLITKICLLLFIPITAVIVVVFKLLNFDTQLSISAAIAVSLISMSYIFHGSMQGKCLFNNVSKFNLIQPFVKLLFGSCALLIGLKFHFVFIVMAIGSICSIIYGYFVLNKTVSFKSKATVGEISPIFKYYIFTFISTTLLTLFNNIDILLVRQYFSENMVGIYSCAALFGKIILYVPSVLCTMLFPLSTKSSTNSKSVLAKTLLYSLLISGAAAVCLYILRDFLMTLVMGAEYSEAANYILPITAVIIPLVLITVLVNYLIAREDKWFVTVSCALCAALSILLTHFIHQSINSLLLTLAVVYCVLFICLLIRSVSRNE